MRSHKEREEQTSYMASRPAQGMHSGQCCRLPKRALAHHNLLRSGLSELTQGSLLRRGRETISDSRALLLAPDAISTSIRQIETHREGSDRTDTHHRTTITQPSPPRRAQNRVGKLNCYEVVEGRKGVRNRYRVSLDALGDEAYFPAPSDARFPQTRGPARKDIHDSPPAAARPTQPRSAVH